MAASGRGFVVSRWIGHALACLGVSTRGRCRVHTQPLPGAAAGRGRVMRCPGARASCRVALWDTLLSAMACPRAFVVLRGSWTRTCPGAMRGRACVAQRTVGRVLRTLRRFDTRALRRCVALRVRCPHPRSRTHALGRWGARTVGDRDRGHGTTDPELRRLCRNRIAIAGAGCRGGSWLPFGGIRGSGTTRVARPSTETARGAAGHKYAVQRSLACGARRTAPSSGARYAARLGAFH
jgi:hypothetical protein